LVNVRFRGLFIISHMTSWDMIYELPCSTLICNLSDFSTFLLSDYSNVTTVIHYEWFSVEEHACNLFGNVKNFAISKFGLGGGKCTGFLILWLDCHILQWLAMRTATFKGEKSSSLGETVYKLIGRECLSLCLMSHVSWKLEEGGIFVYRYVCLTEFYFHLLKTCTPKCERT
jgi:hypothetical protein